MEIVSDRCSSNGNKLWSKQGTLLAFPDCFFSGRDVNRHPQIFFRSYFSLRIVESSKGLYSKSLLSYCDNTTHFHLLGFKSKIMIRRDKNLFLRRSRGKEIEIAYEIVRDSAKTERSQWIVIIEDQWLLWQPSGPSWPLFSVTTADEDRRPPVHCSRASVMAVVNFLEPWRFRTLWPTFPHGSMKAKVIKERSNNHERKV